MDSSGSVSTAKFSIGENIEPTTTAELLVYQRNLWISNGVVIVEAWGRDGKLQRLDKSVWWRRII